jgi:hypothetical protein
MYDEYCVTVNYKLDYKIRYEVPALLLLFEADRGCGEMQSAVLLHTKLMDAIFPTNFLWDSN